MNWDQNEGHCEKRVGKLRERYDVANEETEKEVLGFSARH
jgi:uncharacterized protein YjbJ (UPF0337 family)